MESGPALVVLRHVAVKRCIMTPADTQDRDNAKSHLRNDRGDITLMNATRTNWPTGS